MKNVHYLIHGDVVNVSVINTSIPALKPPVLFVQIIVAFVGIAGIIAIMPVAFTMDAHRIIRFHQITKKRKDENNQKERVLLRPLQTSFIVRIRHVDPRTVLFVKSRKPTQVF